MTRSIEGPGVESFVEVVVTKYAVDIERRVLIGTHATGAGDVAFTVAALPAHTAHDAALRVAARLDSLSRALWRCYTHPAEACAGQKLGRQR